MSTFSAPPVAKLASPCPGDPPAPMATPLSSGFLGSWDQKVLISLGQGFWVFGFIAGALAFLNVLESVSGTRLMAPLVAAGFLGTARAIEGFIRLEQARR